MSRITIIILLATLSLKLAASTTEPPIVIKGIIKDRQTNDLVPFAHVIIDKKVTISNINGEFAITIEDPTIELELKVSYLGYETYTGKIESFDKYYEVFIVPSTTQLKEVAVRSGPEIMERAFNNFHLNYIMEPLHLLSYYQETLRDSIEYYYQAEGIVDIYTPSNLDKHGTPLVHAKRSRKKVYKPISEEFRLAGNAGDMAHSSIWRHDSFLSEKNRRHYEYFYDGTTEIENHEAFIIEFEPKNKKGNTSGKLYIDNITYSILKMEYQPNTKKSDFWDKVAWTEEYELIEGSFQLVNVTFEGSAENGAKNYSAILIVNDTNVNYDVPLDKRLMNVYDTFIEHVDYGDPSATFWEGYHAIKLNDRVAVKIQGKNYDL